jgi:hypothetical protein
VPPPTATPAPTPTDGPTPLAPPFPTPVNVCHHNCPDKIIFGRHGKKDSLLVRSAFALGTVLDPAHETFHIVLSNSAGVIYQGTLTPGDLVHTGKGQRFAFMDHGARIGPGIRGGLASVVILPVPLDAGIRVDVLAFGNLAAATLPDMTLTITLGNDTIARTTTWEKRVNGWITIHR